jgi:hypothetical protein
MPPATQRTILPTGLRSTDTPGAGCLEDDRGRYQCFLQPRWPGGSPSPLRGYPSAQPVQCPTAPVPAAAAAAAAAASRLPAPAAARSPDTAPSPAPPLPPAGATKHFTFSSCSFVFFVIWVANGTSYPLTRGRRRDAYAQAA